MAFQDRSKDNVQSLLALLRSTQDGIPPESQPILNQAKPSIPSKRQLDELLSSLNSSSIPHPSSPAQDRARTTGPADPSAFTKPRPHLIEPFGPVGQLVGPSRLPFSSQHEPTQPVSSSGRTPPKSPQATLDRDDGGLDTLTFSKSLPILTDLLSNEAITQELRKMKASQDALERRLWAKQEKVKADHERSIKADKDIARIARRAIPLEKEAVSLVPSRALSNNLIAVQRLREMGVPGLGGGDDERSKEKLRRVMDVLEAGMEE
ncbi:MAG: hypothetical protein TREMPRED_004553 [Tremellales sp. Tagirdzhanova-0007]|nr:MAG: hypothetical protein TREMPRED_004553 [Tremellales sp. Tagirdzhanova-0007]